jgi:hypothetical protein
MVSHHRPAADYPDLSSLSVEPFLPLAPHLRPVVAITINPQMPPSRRVTTGGGLLVFQGTFCFVLLEETTSQANGAMQKLKADGFYYLFMDVDRPFFGGNSKGVVVRVCPRGRMRKGRGGACFKFYGSLCSVVREVLKTRHWNI